MTGFSCESPGTADRIRIEIHDPDMATVSSRDGTIAVIAAIFVLFSAMIVPEMTVMLAFLGIAALALWMFIRK